MTLEESISKLMSVLCYTHAFSAKTALRQFAEAIAANAAGKPPEPKEYGCPPMAHPGHCCCPNCRESCKPADELPEVVKEAICYYSNVILGMGIDPTKAAHDEIDGYMTKVARLCLSIASRGRG